MKGKDFAAFAASESDMWHARPGSDMEGIETDKAPPSRRQWLLGQAGAEVLVVGHTHLVPGDAGGSGTLGRRWRQRGLNPIQEQSQVAFSGLTGTTPSI